MRSPWTMHVIDSSSFGADGTRLGDVNQDGLPDIVTGWEQGKVARLYFNPGPQKAGSIWPYVQVPTAGTEDAFLADLDYDGNKDLITLSEDNSQKITFYWAPVDNDTNEISEYWNSEVVPVSKGKKWMFGVPMNVNHKNGIDLIVGSKGHNGTVGWLESPKNPRKVEHWQYHEISKAGWIMSIKKIDMNLDGRKDILVSDRYKKNDNQKGVRWLENPGFGPSQSSHWKNHTIGLQDAHPMFLDVADINSDGRKDIIVPTMQQGITVFIRTPSYSWNRKNISFPELAGVRGKAVAVGEIDCNGNPDLVISFEKAEGKAGVMWISDFFSSDREDHNVSGSDGIKFDLVRLLDLDDDGDLDILTSEENNNSASVAGLGVIWYENPIWQCNEE